MTATRKYLFDLHGFVIVEDVLDDAQCELAKAKIRDRMQPLEQTPDGYDARGTWYRAGDLVTAGEPFITLIDHPKLVAVLTEIIGPKLRLESHYSFVPPAQRTFFNTTWEVFGPPGNRHNELPEA